MSKYHPLFWVAFFCLLLPGRAITQSQDKEENLFWQTLDCDHEPQVALYLEFYPQGAYMDEARACLDKIAAAEAQRKAPADYTKSIGMEFKDIPAGSFYMGSCKFTRVDIKENKKRKFMGLPVQGVSCPSGGITNNDAKADELPQHKVHISKGFQMGAYEVTVGQFKQFIAATERYDQMTDAFIKYNGTGDNHPVVEVSWRDAQAFISWLNKKEAGNAYRLPTEAEWEYAARAGTTSKFSWGDSASQADDYAWYNSDSSVGTHAVGGKQPNPWGLYDMHGNVLEWVQDWYGDDYYANSPATDPQGPSSTRVRVLRGGGWVNGEDMRSAGRGFSLFSLFGPSNGLGFRLVRQP